MKIAIMQPYFFPYIGYFQLLNAVDEFVIYDNIQYTKKGWINRNRVLVNGKDEYISLSLKKDSDYLDVKDRFLSDTWAAVDRKKMLNRITESYRKAPYFKEVFHLIEECILCEHSNLFLFILNSIEKINNYLSITTPIVISSTLDLNTELKAVDKVMEICKKRNATHYLNPIGGLELYNKEHFEASDLALNFIKTNPFKYKQFENEYVPFLSIIDVLMFNSKEEVIQLVNKEFQVI